MEHRHALRVTDNVHSVKHFNIAGPCILGEHYMLPPEPRLPRARELIDFGKYFVLHAPRQSGKTTTLATLARALTSEGRYLALHFSCEAAQSAGDDYKTAQEGVLDAIQDAAADARLPPELRPPDPWPAASPTSILRRGLAAWARRCPQPLVLFFDEIDALSGASLISVLSQLRQGHNSRPAPFPHSVVLCGLRDVRDYKMASGGDANRLGTSSPFNIKAASLRIDNFTFAEVAALYGQHTDATGQPFEKEALQRAHEASQGQPWLVNALAAEVTTQMGLQPPEPITDEHMEQAIERLIVDRATHLDSLAAKLKEPRIKQVMEPLIAGTLLDEDAVYDDALSYARDLGLVTQTRPIQVGNPIYQEVVLRVLAARTEEQVQLQPRTLVTPEGRLDFTRLLAEFIEFWKLNGEILTTRETYHEAACQLVFMGFLHRVINGGGHIDREYGVGRSRIDLLIRWPYTDPDGRRAWHWEAIELKVRHPDRPDPVPDGLTQLDAYLDRLGLDTGTLIVFDRRPTAPPLPERTVLTTASTPTGRAVTLLRA
jgi:AAA domain-containing protein